MRRIGKGAYGEVWLARNALGTWRAVKFVRRSSFDDDRPFEREFAGIQRFEPISRSHESQLNILQVGRADDGFYYVMELADDMGRGQEIDEGTYTPRNLRSELHLRGRLPATECLRIGLALTTALEHLHKHGLVHRDIKPSNIVFVNGIPKLADIGLVARAEATMSFVGTEGFLPPEGPGTRQADIYSLGKVLYEISTGHDRQQFPELPTNIVQLPDRAALSELNEVLLKACHRDPKERYQTAAEMHADLALLESGRSVVRLRGIERRLRFVQRAGAAVTAVAALAAGLYLWQAKETRVVRELADQNRQIAEEKTRLAERNREQLVRLSVANGVRLLDEGDSAAALLWFAQALPLVTNRPAEEALHRIRIQQVLDQVSRPLLMVRGGASVLAGAFSPDGHRVALASYASTGSKLAVCDSQSGGVVWEASYGGKRIAQLRFSRDGQRVLADGSDVQGRAGFIRALPNLQIAAVLDAERGQAVFPVLTSNLVRSAFSPDDRWLALARTDHVIELRDARSGKSIVEMKGHTNTIRLLAFNATGSVLASCSLDDTVRLWRIPAGEPLREPLIHPVAPARAVLSDDGERLLTAMTGLDSDAISYVQAWDVGTGQRVGPALTNAYEVSALCFVPGDHNHFLFGGAGSEVSVRDLRTMQPTFNPIKLGSSVRSWDFSSDGTTAVVGSDDGHAYVWAIATGELVRSRFGGMGWKEAVQFSPDGKRLLTTSEGGVAEIWSLQTAAESARLELTANLRKESLELIRPRGKVPGPIPVEMEDDSLRLIDADRLVEIGRLPLQDPGMKFGPWAEGKTGRFWLTSEASDFSSNSLAPCTARLWKLEGSALTKKALHHPRLVVTAAFTPGDSYVVTVCRDDIARVWRTADGSLEKTIPLPGEVPLREPRLESWFTPDASALMISRRRGGAEVLELFDLGEGQLKGNPIPVSEMYGRPMIRFSPNGGYLVSFDGSQSFAIYNLRAEGMAALWAKHGGGVDDVEWSPDGTRLASAGLASWVKIWDAAAGEMLHSPMSIGLAPARAARWNADGRFILSRSDDSFARAWDAATSEPVTPLLRHTGSIRWGCITPRNRLITASDPNLVRAWDLKPNALPADVLAEYARWLSHRRLTDNGVLMRLQPEELAELDRSLRTRAPQLFE